MDVHTLANFYKALESSLEKRWEEPSLRSIAERNMPTGTLGENEWLLRADFALTIGRWFAEGLTDLSDYVAGKAGIGHLYQAFQTSLRELSPHAQDSAINVAARQLTAYAWRQVEARQLAGRKRLDKDLREAVWFRREPAQRCYLCGYQFTQQAKDLFLGRSRTPLTPLTLVDFTRPRGANGRHLRVELDHVVPVAEGGTTTLDNLEIACGWCNTVKSQLWNVYDARSWASGVMRHPSLKRDVVIPQPFWVLRIVAARGKCEGRPNCGATRDDHELFVAPRNPRGALTPTNLMVVCSQHDVWAGHRKVSPGMIPPRR